MTISVFPKDGTKRKDNSMIDLEHDRFGSAGFADADARRRAGLNSKSGAFIGFDEAGRICRSDQQSALVLEAGARWGKGNLVIPWLIDGALRCDQGHMNVISLDLKQQDTMVAGLQVNQGRHIYSYNPRKARGALSHRINPLSAIRPGSPTLLADAMLTSASLVPYSDPKAAYFEGQGQRVVNAALVTLARTQGFVTLPILADKLAGLGEATDEWLSLEYDMASQPEEQIASVAHKLKSLRNQGAGGDGGGWEGIKGEIQRNFAFSLDDQVRASISPPFDFDFEWLNDNNRAPCMVSIMEDLDFVQISAPVLRTLLTCAFITKKRELSARPQFWNLQEVAALAPWPLAETLATTGAGYNIRAAYVVQSTDQFEQLKKGAKSIILNSCGTQIYGGARSLRQAQDISKRLGRVTLSYSEPASQERERAAVSRALSSALLDERDPFEAMLAASHHGRLADHQAKMARDLRTPEEVMGERNDRAFVFMPGVLSKPFYARIPKYWQRRDLAGRYLGDPFHAKPGTVEIATWLGQRHTPVITEPCPACFRDWPQYRDSGMWSYVKGYRL